MPTDFALPLSRWADRQLAGLPLSVSLTGHQLLRERAVLNGFRVPGMVSAGGGCRLYATKNGHVVLSLARPDDRELLPALFGDATAAADEVAARIAATDAASLVEQGAMLGLAIAHDNETPVSPAHDVLTQGLERAHGNSTPRVLDLSALWAGPLATRLLRLCGAKVTRVESLSRPDGMRGGDPSFFARLSEGKASVPIDLRTSAGHDRLRSLIADTDIVITSSRPRALQQLGFDADALVAEQLGLIWISITGHGVQGKSANRIGFGDDCGVAGGLSAALCRASGQHGFVGDAIADPLTGIFAARLAWNQWRRGHGAHIAVSMSGVVAEALAAEAGEALDESLRHWAAMRGQPFP